MEVEVNDANFKQEVLDSNVPVLVDFWAPWCAPCRMVAPIIEEISEKYRGKLKVCKLNVDEAPDAASRYGVMAIPTLAIFRDGKIADKTVGALSKSEVEDMVKKHI